MLSGLSRERGAHCTADEFTFASWSEIPSQIALGTSMFKSASVLYCCHNSPNTCSDLHSLECSKLANSLCVTLGRTKNTLGCMTEWSVCVCVWTLLAKVAIQVRQVHRRYAEFNQLLCNIHISCSVQIEWIKHQMEQSDQGLLSPIKNAATWGEAENLIWLWIS